ncbi:MAG: hypothetical protein JSV38_12245 [Desulfobacterales bacterium]|nr:MAG: hypothetical protein JSV38_12245 [Desulfobacterales bacterium]
MQPMFGPRNHDMGKESKKNGLRETLINHSFFPHLNSSRAASSGEFKFKISITFHPEQYPHRCILKNSSQTPFKFTDVSISKHSIIEE